MSFMKLAAHWSNYSEAASSAKSWWPALNSHASDAYLICQLPNCWANAQLLYRAYSVGAPSSSLAPPAFPPGRTCACQPYGSALPSSGAIFFVPCVCAICMADMYPGILLTGAIEFIFIVLLRPAPYPPPSDPASQHRAAIVSSSLDQGSPAERISSSLALCSYFGFGFGPVVQALSSDGAFFLRLPVDQQSRAILEP